MKSSAREKRNIDGATALILRASEGDISAVEKLLVERANTSAADNKGLTALHHASLLGHTKVVKALIAHSRSEILEQTLDGSTSLHLACCRGHLGVVDELASAGGEPPLQARA